MPRDLFGDVIDPSIRVGSRKWYTVPLSLAAHSLVVIAVIVVPLMATGALPMPHSSVDWMIVTPPRLPSPPAVRRAQPEARPAANPNAAPIEAPSTIEKEPELDAGFEDAVLGGTDLPGGGVIDGAAVIGPPIVEVIPPAAAPLRVGGQIRAPEKIRDVLPIYPALAQAARIQGLVIIEALIGTDGKVQNARVLRSEPMLDQAALAAVRQWVYSPTLLNGVPVAVIMTVTVRFQLQ